MDATDKANYLQKASEFIASASAASKDKNLKGALTFYELGIEYYSHVLNHTSDKDEESDLVGKCHQYLDRAEGIKEFLETGKERSSKPKKASKIETQSMESVLSKMNPDLVAQIEGAVLTGETGVSMDDVIGLDEVKQELDESIQLPMAFPGTMADRGMNNIVLLYGPPGTGKTHLAKAYATAAGSRFFNIRCSDLSSRYHGNSEILIKVMFERAKNCEKSIIFLDECESFCKIRSDHDSNHASSCKTEMLTQLGEIAGHLKVFVIGATNVPYLMDAAFRRRFATQVYIPLPNEKDREKLFRFEVSRWRHILTDKHFKDLAKRTGGYSNSDIAGMAKDARKEPTKEAYYGKYFVAAPNGLMTPCSSEEPNAVEASYAKYGESGILMGPITFEHFVKALKGKKPSADTAALKLLEEYNQDYMKQK